MGAALLLLLALGCSPAREEAATVAPDPTTPPTDASDVLRPTATPVGAGREALPPRTYTPTGPPPRPDVETANVPLDEVLFDTFQGGFIRLSEASDLAVERLRDAIKPVYEPVYDPVQGGDWLDEGDMVIGYANRSGAYAYPLKILNLHEIVNDYIDGVPVLVSYCPLCASAVVYDRRLDGE